MKGVLPSGGTPYRIGFVCLGNICRSPTAEVVLSAKLVAAGLDHLVEVTSCGTGDWHLGQPMDARAASVLRDAGYDPSEHLGRQLEAGWFDLDLLLAMDRTNLADIRRRGGDDEQVQLFRAFDPAAAGDQDVPDPWHEDAQNYRDVLTIVERTCDYLIELLVGLRDSLV